MSADDIKLPELPTSYRAAVYANAINTPAVKQGYEPGGYEKEPPLYTAQQMKKYARAAILADRASRDPSPQGDARPTGATLRCRRCGDTADVSFSYANTEQPDDLLDRVKVEMRHARKFITSRQKMHHVGVEQFDRVYEDVAARSVPATEKGETE